MKGKDVRFTRLPSMMAWLNDYRPKPGKYERKSMGGYRTALKSRKGKYKPKCN
jgi:hypothetical protein